MNTKMQSSVVKYFTNENSMLVFALVYLDGKIRADILGIREELYESERKAKLWRARLLKKVHPDHFPHPEANAATAKLLDIYDRMIGHGEQ